MPAGGQQLQRVQDVRGVRRLRRPRRFQDRVQHARGPADDEGHLERVQQAVAGPGRVRSRQPPRGAQDEHRAVAVVVPDESDLASQPVEVCLLELVQCRVVDGRDQVGGPTGGAGVEVGLSGRERAFEPRGRVQRQRRRAFEERRGGRHSPA